MATPLNSETIRFVSELAEACFQRGVAEVTVGEIKLVLAAVRRPDAAPRAAPTPPEDGARPPISRDMADAMGAGYPVLRKGKVAPP